MENITISVIVPIYNSETHLDNCIESILSQTISTFELLLINDGSEDSSLDICSKWKIKDERIKVINQNNLGVSSARNKGIDNSNGRYILFVDSDDYIKKNTLETLLRYQSNKSSELLVFGMNVFDHHNYEIFHNYDKEMVISIEQLISRFWYYFKMGITNSPVNKLYNLDIINRYNIRFKPEVRIGEDLIFNIDYFNHIQSIHLIDKYLYNYRFHDTQSTLKVDINITKDFLFYFKKIEKLMLKIEQESSITIDWFTHNNQVLKHVITALNMIYKTEGTTKIEKINYIESVIKKFSQFKSFKQLNPVSINEKIIYFFIVRNRLFLLNSYLNLTQNARKLYKLWSH